MAENVGEGKYTAMLREMNEQDPTLAARVKASDNLFVTNHPEVAADHARDIINSTRVTPHESSLLDTFSTPPVLDGGEEKVKDAVARFNGDKYLQLDAAKVTLGVPADKLWNEESIAAVIQNGKMDAIIREHAAKLAQSGVNNAQEVKPAEAHNEKTGIRDVLNGNYLAQRERDAGL